MSQWRLLGRLRSPYLEMWIQREKWISDRIPPVLIRVIGKDNLLNAPFLPWRDRFMHAYRLINGIRHVDVSDALMLGVDCYDRVFMTIRTEKQGCLYVDTLFQKDKSSNIHWVHGFHGEKTWIPCINYHCDKNKLVDLTFLNNLSMLMTTGYVRCQATIYSNKFCLQ